MTSRAAVIGGGPSGFYAADHLLRAGVEVDLFDALPTPFGLVRAGVAPDHPKIKSVTRVYEKIASHPAFRFFGGVTFGDDVDREALRERYHAIVYAVGTASDNKLGIPGEGLPGSHPATELVGWYNGHPAFAGHEFDLSVRRAVVIGNGNVAIDVARMLVLDPDELEATDTADHALDALRAARVEEVVVLGRRGPAQAAFTNPELRELGELSRADVVVDPAELELDAHSAAWLVSEDADPAVCRNVELLAEYACRPPRAASHRIELRFLRSPVELLAGPDGRVATLRVSRNRMEPDAAGNLRAVPTGEEELIGCGLVVRSIGYRGHALPGVPFDERRGLIRNVDGRVVWEDGEPVPGEYVVGWIKRGPSGVIGTNKRCAAETVAHVVADLAAGRSCHPACPDRDTIATWLRERAPRLVTWQGWQAIDAYELAAGELLGRPRVKLVRLPDMEAIAVASR